MHGLSELTWSIVCRMFPPDQREGVARQLIEQCGTTLPFMGEADETGLERVRFAVLKLSGGNLDRLLRDLKVAQQDWRDTLVAAGFGHSLAEHTRWAAAYLAGDNTPGV